MGARASGAGLTGPAASGRSMPGWARGLCGVVVFLLAAEALGRAGVIDPEVLPLASTVPSAAPFIATGIRLASSIAIILNISTGFLTGRISGNGIGAYIAQVYTGAGNTSLVLATALWAGLLGLAAN